MRASASSDARSARSPAGSQLIDTLTPPAAFGGGLSTSAAQQTLGLEAVERLVDRAERHPAAGARFELPPNRDAICVGGTLQNSEKDELLEVAEHLVS